ncbi:MAG: hypothetical protein K8U57_36165 [Planctomycetes bacterium]|nr:hypothetical protein [Planctomycetota bacterium]
MRTPAIRDDAEGKKVLARELYDRFHAMKTYGKAPESLESIVRIFVRDLAAFPLDKIMKAITVHAQRSQEFPTVADISGLIKRGGRAPVTKEVYIAVSRKEPELRTPDDWKLLREYEADQKEAEWGGDEPKVDLAENIRLRERIKKLEGETRRLAGLLADARVAKGLERPKPTAEERILKTIASMREEGASEADIEEFALPYGGLHALGAS